MMPLAIVLGEAAMAEWMANGASSMATTLGVVVIVVDADGDNGPQ